MRIEAKDADGYVAAAPAERRPELETVRAFVKKIVPATREHIEWGMIAFSLDGRTFAALASQKKELSFYLMDLAARPELRAAHAEALAKLDMGKSCIRFAKASELPLDVVGSILRAASDSAPATKPPATKAPAKKTVAKKTAAKKRG